MKKDHYDTIENWRYIVDEINRYCPILHPFLTSAPGASWACSVICNLSLVAVSILIFATLTGSLNFKMCILIFEIMNLKKN